MLLLPLMVLQSLHQGNLLNTQTCSLTSFCFLSLLCILLIPFTTFQEKDQISNDRNLCYSAGEDIVSSYTCHSCGFKDRLMISKSSIAV